MDENIERRNHYLDLAGIENYTSQFGPGKGACAPGRQGKGRAGLSMRGGVHYTPLGWGKMQVLQDGLKTLLGGDDIKTVLKMSTCPKLNKIKWYLRASHAMKTIALCLTPVIPLPPPRTLLPCSISKMPLCLPQMLISVRPLLR